MKKGVIVDYKIWSLLNYWPALNSIFLNRRKTYEEKCKWYTDLDIISKYKFNDSHFFCKNLLYIISEVTSNLQLISLSNDMIFNLIPVIHCQAICLALSMGLKMLHRKTMLFYTHLDGCKN